MLSMIFNTITPVRRPGMNQLQMVCHCLVPMLKDLSGLLIQFIQLKIVIQKSFHTIREITLSTMNNIPTPLRRHGMSLLQMACHCLAPMLKDSGLLVQSTQLRIVTLKSSHTTREITLTTRSSIPTPLKRPGMSLLQMEWLYQELMLNRVLDPINKKVSFNS
jgi:hypothetical protein